jgi:hypothetical protein
MTAKLIQFPEPPREDDLPEVDPDNEWHDYYTDDDRPMRSPITYVEPTLRARIADVAWFLVAIVAIGATLWFAANRTVPWEVLP